MEWISSHDRLPAIGDHVLCSDQFDDMFVAYIDTEGDWTPVGVESTSHLSDVVIEGIVTHWMYLPKPPK